MYKDPFTGKYHTHFRDYDPITCRWLSEDPAGYADGLNLYNAYMGVNGRDVLGLHAGHDSIFDVFHSSHVEENVQSFYDWPTGVPDHFSVQNAEDKIKRASDFTKSTIARAKRTITHYPEAVKLAYWDYDLLGVRGFYETGNIAYIATPKFAKGGVLLNAFRRGPKPVYALVGGGTTTYGRGLTLSGDVLFNVGARGSGAYGQFDKPLNISGTTKEGIKRGSKPWLDRWGPALLRKHHLVPQALLKNKKFMTQLRRLGYSFDDIQRYVHKQVAEISNVKHANVHSQGWNRDWTNWVNANPYFTTKDLNKFIKNMMKEYNIPKSTRTSIPYK